MRHKLLDPGGLREILAAHGRLFAYNLLSLTTLSLIESTSWLKRRPILQKSLIPRKALFGNPDRVSPQLSPDGKKLSFLAPVNGVLNVWVGPPENPDLAEAVTQDTGRGIRSHSWAYNNNCLLYVQDQDGDENWHLYRVDLTSGDIKDLTPL